MLRRSSHHRSSPKDGDRSDRHKQRGTRETRERDRDKDRSREDRNGKGRDKDRERERERDRGGDRDKEKDRVRVKREHEREPEKEREERDQGKEKEHERPHRSGSRSERHGSERDREKSRDREVKDKEKEKEKESEIREPDRDRESRYFSMLLWSLYFLLVLIVCDQQSNIKPCSKVGSTPVAKTRQLAAKQPNTSKAEINSLPNLEDKKNMGSIKDHSNKDNGKESALNLEDKENMRSLEHRSNEDDEMKLSPCSSPLGNFFITKEKQGTRLYLDLHIVNHETELGKAFTTRYHPQFFFIQRTTEHMIRVGFHQLGPCSLKITYSAHTDLSVKFQSHRSRDYTNPMLPVASSTIDAIGQAI
ncbi:unnamed protein product [Lactuca virosa]|uniref:Uncharacterized protein n=1 Tax=Lactuca virosa TaxID=75947 RepID=A0AAU9M4A4_9ASTR|nr:unnamed protein product [Lactuca virosa]